LLESRSLEFADQDALNLVVDGAWTELEPRFNAQTGHFFARDSSVVYAAESPRAIASAAADPIIVHYNAGRPRPWQRNCLHPFRDEWISTLDQTAYAGWRPPPTTRASIALARMRTRLANTVRVALKG
jgi:lipopolysaccharide biosynthesis glycosyltransferase